MLQPSLNPSGWGYDLCYSHFCSHLGGSFGVIDNQIAIHQKVLGRLKVNTNGLADQYLHSLVSSFPLLLSSHTSLVVESCITKTALARDSLSDEK
jgi:hypothetical protein